MKRSFVYATLLTLLVSCGKGDKKDDANVEERMTTRLEHNEVEVDTLRLRPFMREIVSNGRLEAARRSELSFAVTGVVESVAVKNGTRVGQGALLARVDTTEYSQQLRRSLLTLEKSRLEYLDVLVGLGYTLGDTITPPQDVLRLAKIRSGYADALASVESDRRNLKQCSLRAPFGGKVADVATNAYERTGDKFCVLLDDSRLNVRFTVLESEYGALQVGQTVAVTPYADLKREVSGHITAINPTIDNNGQVQVDATIANDGTLTDGMNVKVFVRQALDNQLVVPKSAVVIRDNLEVLFRYENGAARWTYVHTSLANSKEYVVRANEERGAELKVGDIIITSGNLNLADGSEVTIKQ